MGCVTNPRRATDAQGPAHDDCDDGDPCTDAGANVGRCADANDDCDDGEQAPVDVEERWGGWPVDRKPWYLALEGQHRPKRECDDDDGDGNGDADHRADVEPVFTHQSHAFRKRRSVTIAGTRLSRAEMAEGAALIADDADEVLLKRPQTRADCIDGPRPCPWVGCRHHLYLDVNPDTGSIKLNFPEQLPDELEHSCALDLASFDGITLEGVGSVLNITRERIRQVEVAALERIKEAPSMRLEPRRAGT